jgi:hypothetical protein
MNAQIARLLTVAVCLLLTAPLAAQDEAPLGDARLRPLLAEAGLIHELDPDGEYRLLLEFEDGRTQLVFIRSGTSNLEGLEVRESYSPGCLGDTLASSMVMTLLLHANHDVIMGAWEYQASTQGDVALFCARIPADPDAAVLRRLVGLVGQVADDMEELLTGKDDL